jgi:hypothetical protein
MNAKDIERWIEEELIEKVSDIEGDRLASYETNLIGFATVREFLEKQGYTYLNEEFSTNGWQVDFWAYFAKPATLKDVHEGENLKDSYNYYLCVSGSFYYGDTKISAIKNFKL